jgi:hypothetical protein
LIAPFDDPKHKFKKNKKFHDNIVELKVNFELKLILIQWLDEED